MKINLDNPARISRSACHLLGAPTILVKMKNTDLAYYPADYQTSRQLFRSTIEGLGKDLAEMGSWAVPSALDPDLFVDYSYLPATQTPERLFLIISGVHGLEAYTGCGIQQLFLREFLPRFDHRRNGLLLVHSLNPFGFKYHRRCTENGVNLNRNCSIHPELYQIKNEPSLQISRRFIPQEPVKSTQSHMLSRMKIAGHEVFFDELSMDEIVKHVGKGQFETHEGLEFGGHRPEPQVQALIDKLKQVAPQYRDLILFDLHTGLGDRGRLHLLRGDHDRGVNLELFQELFKTEDDKAIYDYTPTEVSGFYRTHGATNDLFPELAANHQRCCTLTLEFGTIGHSLEAQIDGLNRWVLEHQGTIFGYANKNLEQEIKSAYLERFFPSQQEWQQTIIQTSRAFFDAVMGRSGALKT